MNRSKRPIFDKLRKQMSKAIGSLKHTFFSPEDSKYIDAETEKELLKKFPNRKPAKKKEELLSAIEKKFKTKQKKHKKGVSKRTSPGKVPADSSPASSHREGQRWIKSLTSQTLADRKVQDHRGRKK